jgi:hypothetical protein
LVHAAQQRRLGSNLPTESSPEGRTLEAEALDAERALGGQALSLTSDEPLRHAAPPVTASWVDDRIQHAKEHTPPQPDPFPLDSKEEKSVSAWAQTVLKEYLADGGSLGGGGGGGAFVGSLDTAAVGQFKATNEKEFRQNMKDMINKERAERGMPPIEDLSDAQSARADKMFADAEAERAKAKEREEAVKGLVDTHKEKKKELEEAKAKDEETKTKRAETIATNAAELGALAWTADKGFHKPDGTSARDKVSQALAKLNAVDVDEHDEDEAEHLAESASKIKLKDTEKAPKRRDLTKSEDLELALQFEGVDAEGLSGAGGMRNSQEWVDAALNKYNQERAERGMPTIPRFEPWQEQIFIKQFDDAMGATIVKKRKAAAIADEKAKAIAAMTVVVPTTQTTTADDGAQDAIAPVVTAAPQPATSAVVTAPTPLLPHELDSHHLEELTQRIYDRLRSRLRTELLVDRERAGLLTDFR